MDKKWIYGVALAMAVTLFPATPASAADANQLYEQGVSLYDQYGGKLKNVEKLEEAVESLQAAAQADPPHPHAPTMLKLVQGKLNEANKKISPDYWAMAFSVIGGLGIFLIGMRYMSDGMQAVAGQRLRRMINAVTDNRLMAVGVGTGVTCFVQSSSITTVIVVGLVNSGLMLLHQAIGVIMGANIGTTITGWILALKIGKYGLPILGVSALFYLFAKRDRWRYIAMTTMGLGMVFFGLALMKNGFKPMKGVPMFEEAFAWFVADSYFGVLKCAFVGCILTFLVQSSSATLGITIGLASTGAIPFETAAALVLGENIGTTITAWLASIGATTNAKRAAYAHVLFNLFGVLWITALFAVYVKLVGSFVQAWIGHNPIGLSEDVENYAGIVTFGIAAVHTGFNVTNTVIFLPFVRRFATFLERVIPDKGVKETPHLSSLDLHMVGTPSLAVITCRGEIVKMSQGVRKMLDWTGQLRGQRTIDEQLTEKVFHRERIMDNVQQEVIDFLSNLLTGEVSHEVTQECREQLRVADEFESISDYVSQILKADLRVRENNLTLADSERQNLDELHEQVAQYLELVSSAFEHRQSDVLVRAETQGHTITQRVKDLRDAHLERLSQSKVDPVVSMSYNQMLNAYRKIRDHAINIAEALAPRG